MTFELIVAILLTIARYAWMILRPILGWFLILVGLVGIPLPIIHGTVFLIMGISLVGRRHIVIRWCRVQGKLFLRHWATLHYPVLRATGRLAVRVQRNFSRKTRRLMWWYQETRVRAFFKRLSDQMVTVSNRYARTSRSRNDCS